MKKLIKNIFKVLLLVIIVGLIGASMYIMDYPVADETALALIETIGNDEKNPLKIEDLMSHMIVEEKDEDASTGIILYPEARMDSRSYIFLAEALAKKGYFVVILKCMFNIPSLSKGYAEVSILDYERIQMWYVGGFAQGGIVGSEYVNIRSENPKIRGTILLDSYSTVNIPKDKKALVISVEENSKMKREDFEKNKENLPENTEFQKVQNGNHFYINTRIENEDLETLKLQIEKVTLLIDEFVK